MPIQKIKTLCLVTGLLAGSVAGTTVMAAEGDPNQTCSSAASLFKDGDVDGALEEARWCVTQLEQIKQKEVAAFFKDSINGYQGGELNQQQAMGMSMVERSYTKGGSQINVSLSAGASGATNNAFAALASFGMQMGGPGNKIRIQKRSAMVTNENGKVSVTVTLKSGGMLTFESNSLSSDAVVAFAKKFPVANLDNSRN